MDAREYVTAVFGWDEERFKRFAATLAHNYCFHYTGGDASLMRELIQTGAFWQWFFNGLHNRNIQFMQAHQNGSINPYTPYTEYLLFYQNAQKLAQEIYPGPEVWAQISGRDK